MPTIGKDIAFFAPFVAYHAVDRKALTFFRDRSVASTQICADPIIGLGLPIPLRCNMRAQTTIPSSLHKLQILRHL
jgi:hypothetical protein